MKEFKKYVKTEDSKKQKQTKETLEKCEENGMNIPKDAIENMNFDKNDMNFVKNLAEKYTGKKDLLIDDIKKIAAKNRKEGKLNDKQLDSFKEKITPMLNSKQKKMLNDIMGMIKNT